VAGEARSYMDSSLRGPAEPAHGDDVVVVRAGRSVRSVYAEDEEQEGVRAVNDVRKGERGPSHDARGMHADDRAPPGNAPREAGAGRARPRAERAAALQAPAGARRQPGAPERGGRAGGLGGAPGTASDGAGAPASPAGAAPAAQAGPRPGGAPSASNAPVPPQLPKDGGAAAVPAGSGPAAGPAAAAAPSVKALRDARARDAARRPVLPYDDSDYDEEEGAGRRGAASRARPGARRAGAGGAEAGAGGREGGVEAPPAAPGGGGGEFEAGAGPDARSAAELTALDTFRHAEEEYPKWEEELFGSPAGARPAHPAVPARSPAGCLAAMAMCKLLLMRSFQNQFGEKKRAPGLAPCPVLRPSRHALLWHLISSCMSSLNVGMPVLVLLCGSLTRGCCHGVVHRQLHVWRLRGLPVRALRVRGRGRSWLSVAPAHP